MSGLIVIDPHYDPSQEPPPKEEAEDSDMERERMREVNASILANPEEAKALGFKVVGASELKDNPLFEEEETAEGVKFMAVKPWKGAIVAPTAAPKNNPAAPDKKLAIEWVYGYRGWETRSNVVFNSDNHVVYPVAALGVVYDAKAHAQRHYTGHTDDIVCLAQNPADPDVVATGQVATIEKRRGTPPHICVWNTKTLQGYKLAHASLQRQVRTLGFSQDGKYLAAVGDDDKRTVMVFDLAKKALIASKPSDGQLIYQVRWSNTSAQQFVTVGAKGHCFVWTLNGTSLAGARVMYKNYTPQTLWSVAFSAKGYIVAGAHDGSVYVFVDGLCRKQQATFSSKVHTIDRWEGGIVLGSSDRQVKVLNTSLACVKTISFKNKVTSVYIKGDTLLVGTHGSEIFVIPNFNEAADSDQKMTPVVQGHFDGELWGMSPNIDGKTFVTAGEDNTVRLWDIAKRKQLRMGVINEKKGGVMKITRAATTSTFPPNQCARAVAISPDGEHCIVGANSGEVHVYTTRDLQKIYTQDLNKYGRRNVTNQTGNWIQEIKYSPSGRTCAVGTHGSVICLLDVNDGYKCKGTLLKHNSFITHIDWSKDGNAMQSNCGAYELLFWGINESDLKSSAQQPSAKAYRDVQWATWTCTFGWPVEGIWDPLMDGTDINSVDRSPDQKLLVAGNDFSKVCLWRYPVNQQGNAKHEFGGHSSHVVTVRWTPDGQRVLSTGGEEKSVIQWKLV